MSKAIDTINRFNDLYKNRIHTRLLELLIQKHNISDTELNQFLSQIREELDLEFDLDKVIDKDESRTK